MREKRRVLLKFSLPAASAGKGAFVIHGYYFVTFRMCSGERPMAQADSDRTVYRHELTVVVLTP